MNLEDSKIVKTDESQSTSPKVDNSRRSFAKRSAVIAPVIMTLANKTALGATPYHCTVSGQQSGNHSGAHDWTTPCDVGDSPLTWVSYATSNLSNWIQAGASPFRPNLVEQRTVVSCSGSGLTRDQRTRIQIQLNPPNWRTVSDTTVTGVSSCTASTTNNGSKKYYFDGTEYYQSDIIYDQIQGYDFRFRQIFGGRSTAPADFLLNVLNDSTKPIDQYAVACWLNAGLRSSNFSPVYDDITDRKSVV